MSGVRKLAVVLATGFGLGLSPFASGTFGTLLGVALVYFLWPILTLPRQIIFAAVCVLAAVPICDAAEKVFQTKDDGRIVADEYLTFPLCMLGLPVHPLMLLAAFLTHRVMDIFKPWPARSLQRLHGGVGIVIDDVFAALYSLALNYLLLYAWNRFA